MNYPLTINYRSDLTCLGYFPDIPEILVEGMTLKETIETAQEALIQVLLAQLKGNGTINEPSDCRLGQHLIAVPDSLAARIKIKNSITRQLVKTFIY